MRPPLTIDVERTSSDRAGNKVIWQLDDREVDLALLMDLECPDNPFVSAFPPWLIALSLAFFRGKLISASQ